MYLFIFFVKYNKPALENWDDAVMQKIAPW